MKICLPDSEKIEYLSFFSEKEALFQTLVNLGKIILVDGPHDTAWVTFDKEGQYLNFYFNNKFWESLSFYERSFIIGHECLHVLLYHGVRLSRAEEKLIANIAADLVVNHLLILRFSFDKEKLPIAKSLCWRENIFENMKNVRLPDVKDSTYEIYYKILLDNAPRLSSSMKSIDEHNGSSCDCENDADGDSSNEEEKKEIPIDEMSDSEMEDFINKTFDESTTKDVNNFISNTEKHLPAENTYGPNPYSSHSTNAKQWRAKANNSWKRIFAKVAKQAMKISEKEYLQWVKKSRRNNLLPSDLIVPHSVDVDEMKQDKLFIHLYIDFSGSCRNLQKDFWLAYDSIPKKLYEVDLYTYSDVIYSVDKKKRNMQGTWGNAPFQIIENNIQKLIKDKKLKKYPHCIVVFTDGHASGVKSEKPSNWIWILPKQGSTTVYLPIESQKIWLEDINTK